MPRPLSRRPALLSRPSRPSVGPFAPPCLKVQSGSHRKYRERPRPPPCPQDFRPKSIHEFTQPLTANEAPDAMRSRNRVVAAFLGAREHAGNSVSQSLSTSCVVLLDLQASLSTLQEAAGRAPSLARAHHGPPAATTAPSRASPELVPDEHLHRQQVHHGVRERERRDPEDQQRGEPDEPEASGGALGRRLGLRARGVHVGAARTETGSGRKQT